jgi:chaperonin GroEL (HSP60 family)
MNNAGLKGDLNLHKVIESDKMGMGFDLDDDTKLQDMKKIGIVDPALVVREVIQNSVAQAGLAITTGAIIAEIPPK